MSQCNLKEPVSEISVLVLVYTNQVSLLSHFRNEMKERASKLTYPTFQHCLKMLHIINANASH